MLQRIRIYIIIDEVPAQGLRFPEEIRKMMVGCVFPALELDHLGPLLQAELVYNRRGCNKYYYVTEEDFLKSLRRDGRNDEALKVSNHFINGNIHGVVFSGDCCRLLN